MSPLALVVIGAFIIVSLIIVGVYWALIVRPETEGRTKLHKRLKVSAGDIGAAAVSTKLEKKGRDDVKVGRRRDGRADEHHRPDPRASSSRPM